MKYEAHWSDGRSAARRPVHVRIVGPRLVVTDADDHVLAELPAEGLSLAEEVYRGQPLRFRHDAHPAAVLTVRDHGLLERLLPHAPQLGRRYLARRSTLQRLAIWAGALVLVVAGLLGLVHYGTGPLAALAPDSWRDAVGERILAAAAEQAGTCESDAGRRALETLAARLSTAAGGDGAFEIRVLDAETVNAFAAPGGYIGIYRGLIEQAGSPGEVAGVLAHEMAHAIERHPTEGLIRAVGYRAVLAALLGDASSAFELAGRAGETLLNRAHSRAAEREADRVALRLMRQADMDPGGLARFFRRLREEQPDASDAPAWLSTHPPRDDRIRAAEAAGDTDARPALDDARWEALQGICKTDGTEGLKD